MDVNIMLEKGELMGLIKISEREVHYSHLDKTYRADPEELVRAATYVYLCSDLEYPPSRIELEVVPLRRDPSNPADIIVYSDDELNSRFIVCEIKAESTPGDIEQAKRQGLGNANLQGSHYLLCVCDTEELAYNVSSQPSLRNLEHYRVAQLPVSYGQAPTYRYVKGGAPDFELRRLELHELINKFDRAHQALWQAGRLDSLTAFDEMSKIMFAKLFDEIHTPAGEPYHCQIGTDEGVSAVAARTRSRYREAQRSQPAMLMEEITASDDILVEVVGILQDTSLFQTDLNAKGRAFEQFISKYFRGDVGQYFTPRNVVHAVCQISDSLKAFSPQANYIDPACGSGGFLLELLTQVRKRLAIAHQGDPLLAQRLQLEFARDHLFGIETNEKIARVAMMDMVIHDDGSSNIRRADALDDFAAVDPSRKIRQGTFDYVLTNPPFGDSIDNRTPYYDSYQLGGAGDIARGKSQRIEVLFIERCLDLLSEEGLLAIVLPDSALTNIENIPVNDFILSRAIYLGALSLPQHAFSPFGSDVKTSVFFFRKSAEAGKYFEQREEFIRRRDALYQDTTLSPAELSSSYGELREEYASIDYPIMLGSVDISAQPNESASEVQEAEIAAGQFVEAREDSAVMLDLVDETLDQVALLVQMMVIVALLLAARMGRYDRNRTLVNNERKQVIGIV